MNTDHMPGTSPGNLTQCLQQLDGGMCYYPHCTDEVIKAPVK